MSLRPFALLLALVAAGCPNSPPPAAPAPAAPAPAAPTAKVAPQAVEDRELPVKCGCKLEDVKKCSEWAQLDGQWVQLTGNHGLGSMPFCGKENLKAKVTGHVENDGKLHLTKITVVQ